MSFKQCGSCPPQYKCDRYHICWKESTHTTRQNYADKDLIARGATHDASMQIIREVIVESGFDFDKLSASSLNVLHRAIAKAHKLGWTEALERVKE